MFERPHGLFICPNDFVYVVDDWNRSVYKFTSDGELLMTIETKDNPADTGYIRGNPEAVVTRAGPPFNQPTGCALGITGDLYVTDGYGNARVHRFTSDGNLRNSWGQPGSGPGQFDAVHGVCVDKNGLIHISDRMNTRIQIFNQQGEYLSEWDDVRYPNNMCMDAEGNFYVGEMGGIFLYGTTARLDKPHGRITVRNPKGERLCEWDEGGPIEACMYFAPHGIAIDSHGDLYVGEVTASYNFGQAPDGGGVLGKYIKK